MKSSNHCSQCGATLKATDRFCPDCGVSRMAAATGGSPRRKTRYGILGWGTLGLVLVCILCSVVANLSRGEKTATPRPLVAVEVKATVTRKPSATQPPTRTPTLAPVGTKRTNPVPLGDTLRLRNNLTLRIVRVRHGGEAYAVIREYNMFNPKAVDGSEWLLIDIEATYDGDPAKTFTLNVRDFKFVTEAGVTYGRPHVVLNHALDVTLFGGGSVTGEVAFIAEVGERGLCLIYAPFLESVSYLALEE